MAKMATQKRNSSRINTSSITENKSNISRVKKSETTIPTKESTQPSSPVNEVKEESVIKPIENEVSNASDKPSIQKTTTVKTSKSDITIPQYGSLINDSKRDIYHHLRKLRNLNLDDKNPIISIYEQNTMSLKKLSLIEISEINGTIIDTVFDMYKNMCTYEGSELLNIGNKENPLEEISTVLVDIIEHAFIFIENAYERRKIKDEKDGNRTYFDTIESIYRKIK